MEEPPVHPGALQEAHRAGVGVRQDRFRSGLGDDAPEPAGNRVQRFIPGDRLEPALPLAARPAERPAKPRGAVLTFEIAGNLGAQEPARNRVIRVALNPRCLPAVELNQESARIRTIERANRMQRLGHVFMVTAARRPAYSMSEA